MNILFIDESEQSKKQYIGVGGLIIKDDSISNLCALFKRNKEKHGIPEEVEIKWAHSWLRKHQIEEQMISAYSDILNLIESFNAKIIVAVIKNENTQDTTEAKWKCLEFVTERFQFFLQGQQNSDGIIIADFPGSGKEEKELLLRYYRLLDKGTYYVKPKNIVMNLLTTESHLNPVLQLADLVVGITTCMCTPGRKYTLPYWNLIRRNLHCNRDGQVIGCGLKIFPREKAKEILPVLFPEVEETTESHEEYIERMRCLYSVLMNEDELDIYFPRY